MKTVNKTKAAKLLLKMGGRLPDSFFVPKSYALTDKDMATIASKITVPIVEKVVEKTEVKTEVIRETPTITEITKVIKEVDFDQLLEALKPQILLWIMSKMNTGGGQANRDEKVNSLNVLRPFTDINWIAGSGMTISAVANQTTKYTDITLSSSGGTGATVTTQVVTATQSGSDAVIALSQLIHFATYQAPVILVLRNQIPQTLGVTYTETATDVTVLNADAGEIYAITYSYT